MHVQKSVCVGEVVDQKNRPIRYISEQVDDVARESTNEQAQPGSLKRQPSF